MYDSPVISALLTLGFVVTGVGFLMTSTRPHAPLTQRVSDLLHVVMSVAMVVMAWDARMVAFPAGVQLIVFALGCVYFVLLAGRALAAGAYREAAWQGFHALMMVAMVFMALVMLPMGGPVDGMDAMPEHSMTPWYGAWTLRAWAAVFAAAALALAALLIATVQGRSRLRQPSGAPVTVQPRPPGGVATLPSATGVAQGSTRADQHDATRLTLLLLMTVFMGLGFAL